MRNNERTDRYAALVIYPDERIRDMNAIAGKEAKKAFHTKEYINIREMIYSSLLDVYVAICELPKKKDGEQNHEYKV